MAGGADTLSQAEIDALLAAVAADDVAPAAIDDDDPYAGRVQTMDFRRPSKFNRDQLRTLEMLHETFSRLGATYLSGTLRSTAEISVLGAEQVTYGEFISSLPVPALTGILELAPLDTMAILAFDLPLVFTMIDRVLGGPGQGTPRLRELTDIEGQLARGMIHRLLHELSTSWNELVGVEFGLRHIEMNPQFAQVAAPGDIAVLISFEMRVGSSSGMLHLCVPHIMLEPMLGGLSAQSYYSSKRGESSPDLRQAIVSELGAVSVPVSVELGHTHLHVADLLALAPGDVIPLDITPGADVYVRVGDRGTFLGQPGTRGKRLAVQITRQIEEPMQGARS